MPPPAAFVAGALAQVDFLSHLTSAQREKHVPRLVDQSFLRFYDPGQLIAAQGEHGHSMFVLVHGAVALDLVAEGQHRRLAVLSSGPGGTPWFGEGAVLGRTLRGSTATSVAKSIVLEIEKVRLERLDATIGGILERIDRASQARTIATYLAGHRDFSRMSPEERGLLVGCGRVRTAKRSEVIFAEDDSAPSVLIVVSGVAKLSQRGPVKPSILAYYSAGDVAGTSDGRLRAGTLEALGAIEMIEVDRRAFERAKASASARLGPEWAEGLEKALNVKQKQLADAVSSKTGMLFVEQFLKDGAQAAQSLVVVDLDRCVRCGSCVVACESRHGHARMTRRGKTLVRRRSEESAEHQTILLPSSCRHCESPECLIGCPTGAIHRKPTGEVAIRDTCIGCSNCALRCPWDNITMVETPGRWVLDAVTGAKLATPKLASKCDLCAGYEQSACVNNCPTGAIMRVEPGYFPEVRAALGAAPGTDQPKTRAAERKDRRPLAAALLAVLAAAGLFAFYRSAAPFVVWSFQGIVLGGVALALMAASAGLALRKRMAHRLGAYSSWVLAHYWLGALSLVAALLHADFTQGSTLTAVLIWLLALQVFLGVATRAVYAVMPRVVVRLERGSQVIEDVREEHRALLERRAELLGGRTREDAGVVEALARDAARIRELVAVEWAYRVRGALVATHIALTGMLAVLVGAHLLTALYFFWRVRG